MTKSVLFGAVTLALTITAASAEDVESANYMMPGCRAFAMEMEYAPAGVCAGRIYGMLFMASVIGVTLQSASPSDASSPLRNLSTVPPHRSVLVHHDVDRARLIEKRLIVVLYHWLASNSLVPNR
jgi:hypothetical protein